MRVLDSRDRILVWGLSNNRAGTEAVISNYVHLIDDQKFDFLTFESPGNYGDLFSGQRENRYFVIRPKSINPIRYYRDLNRFMSVHASEYKALWFNTNHAANLDLLRLAKRYGVPRRIVHSHNSEDPAEPLLKALCRMHSGDCIKLATELWACSSVAGRYLFGEADFRLVPNIVDSDAFSYSVEKRADVRKSLQIGNSLVIGTVGGLVYQKNQVFLMDLLSVLLAEGTDCHLVIVGEGELRQTLLGKAREMGLSSRVHLVGAQSDIQAYLSSFDIFAFPSHFEGLPVSLIEAQFNGVPCLCSDNITDEAILSRQVIRLPLGDLRQWVELACSVRRERVSQLNEKARLFDSRLCRENASRLFV